MSRMDPFTTPPKDAVEPGLPSRAGQGRTPNAISLHVDVDMTTSLDDFEFLDDLEIVSYDEKSSEFNLMAGEPCCCDADCNPENCPCCCNNIVQFPALFDRDGRFIPIMYDIEYDEPISICSPLCTCENCIFSPKRPHQLHVLLKKTARKGAGVFAKEFIPKGKFICFYVGEIIDDKEARCRLAEYDVHGHGHALLSVRQHMGSEQNQGGGRGNAEGPDQPTVIHIDATKRGNIARFINHDCGGGNLTAVLFHFNHSGINRIGFISKRDIQPTEEILLSYGAPNKEPTSPSCFCDSSKCLGFLPKDY